MARTGNPAPTMGPGAPRAGRQEVVDGHGPAASAQLIHAAVSRLAAKKIPSGDRIVHDPIGLRTLPTGIWMRCHGKYDVRYSPAATGMGLLSRAATERVCAGLVSV